MHITRIDAVGYDRFDVCDVVITPELSLVKDLFLLSEKHGTKWHPSYRVPTDWHYLRRESIDPLNPYINKIINLERKNEHITSQG